MYQDKESTTFLEINGKGSAGKRIRALNIHYFFMTDQVEEENVQIKYCLTDKMVEIDPCLLRVLYWNFSVHYLIQEYTSIKAGPRHALFHYFLSDYSKHDAATTTSHRKLLIELLKEGKLLTSSLSKIWEIMVVVHINIDVPLHYTLCQLCRNVTKL